MESRGEGVQLLGALGAMTAFRGVLRWLVRGFGLVSVGERFGTS